MCFNKPRTTLYEGLKTEHQRFKFSVIEDDKRDIDIPVEGNL